MLAHPFGKARDVPLIGLNGHHHLDQLRNSGGDFQPIALEKTIRQMCGRALVTAYPGMIFDQT